MATAARGWSAFRVYLEMIKIEHSVFALPFALTGALLAIVTESELYADQVRRPAREACVEGVSTSRGKAALFGPRALPQGRP